MFARSNIAAAAMALLLLLPTVVESWAFPVSRVRLSTTKIGSTTDEVANAWSSMDADMERNDLAALEVMKELRVSLQCLEKTLSQQQKPKKEEPSVSTTTTPTTAIKLGPKELHLTNEVVTALDTMDVKKVTSDTKALRKLQHLSRSFQTVVQTQAQQEDEAAAQLVAQLAAMEARDHATRLTRIEHAKEASNHVTMQAKYDQQKQLYAPPPPFPSDQEEEDYSFWMPNPLQLLVTPPTHVKQDPEVQALIAQLAGQEATDFTTYQARIQKAKEASEFVTMQAKLDLQQQHPMEMPAPQEVSHDLPTMPHDPAADALVAQLAAMDFAQHQTRETRISHAKEASNHVTMEAKWDLQQQYPAKAPPKKTETELPTMPHDEEANALVAQLAALEAAELAARETLISKAKLTSEHMMMQDKIQQQLDCYNAEMSVPQVFVPSLQSGDSDNFMTQQQQYQVDEKEKVVDRRFVPQGNFVPQYDIDGKELVARRMLAYRLSLESRARELVRGTPAAAAKDKEVFARSMLAYRLGLESRGAATMAPVPQNDNEVFARSILKYRLDLESRGRVAARVPVPVAPTVNVVAPRKQQDNSHSETFARNMLGYRLDLERKEMAVKKKEMATKKSVQSELLHRSLLASRLDLEAKERAVSKSIQKELLHRNLLTSRLDLEAKKEKAPASATRKEAVFVQAHEIMDAETAALVTQLASMEAKEFAIKQGRIDKAKEHSNFVTMQAKLDQQQAFPAAAQPLIFKEQAWDEEAVKLVAQLAAQDVAAHEEKQARIQHAKDYSEFVTMQAKLDQQQQQYSVNVNEDDATTTSETDEVDTTVNMVGDEAAVDVNEADAVAISETDEVDTTINMVDDEAAALAADQLAAEEAEEAAAKEELLVQSAKEASEFVTQETELDQPEAVVPVEEEEEEDVSVKEDVFTNLMMDALDEETAELVAELAALEAAEVAAKESAERAIQEATSAAEAERFEETLREIKANSTFLDGDLEVIEQEDFRHQVEAADEAATQELTEYSRPAFPETTEHIVSKNGVNPDNNDYYDAETADVQDEESTPFFFASRRRGKKNRVDMKDGVVHQTGVAHANGVFYATGGEEVGRSAAEMAEEEYDEIQEELQELFTDVKYGFKEVKKELAQLVGANSTSAGESDDDWGGFSP